MSFSFEVVSGVPVPSSSAATTSHPFPWGAMKEGDAFLVPQAYWIDERGVEKAKYSAATAREKIKNSFYTWRKQNGGQHKDLAAAPRTLSGPTDKFTDAVKGDIAVWLIKAPATSAKKPPAKKAAAAKK